MSSLFKLASQAARRAASQRMAGSGPLLARAVGAARSYIGTFGRVMSMPKQDALRALKQIAREQARQVQAPPGELTAPPRQQSPAVRQLLDLTERIERMGRPSAAEADRLIDQITGLLQTAKSDPSLTMRQQDKLAEIAEVLALRFAGAPPVGAQPTETDYWGPEEELDPTYWEEMTPGRAQDMAKGEIKTPQSSNVYSYWWEPEEATSYASGRLRYTDITDRPEKHLSRKSKGTLFVTFKSWTPGQKGKRPNSPGPTYAYRSVPLETYQDFERTAGRSPGGAVWDYLRVRGSVYGHQFQYRLVAGALVPGGGEYVPRKATARGYKARRLGPKRGAPGRTVASTLPPREFSEATRRYNRQLAAELREQQKLRRRGISRINLNTVLNTGRPNVNRGRPNRG